MFPAALHVLTGGRPGGARQRARRHHRRAPAGLPQAGQAA